ncbi:MAG: threonylcarbamoyl-AMP synthase [Muribaculaceae bacterium]|nr:threonylcarbamoyl-AMP synthase [Muribaculaceae bacterium]
MKEDVRKAVECMRKGGIILYPTDTIWGIGCDATNEAAVRKIYELKRRADSKSMIVLTDSESGLEKIVEDVPEVAWQLIDAAVTPLTIIYDKAINVAPSLVAEDGSIGVRITKEDYSRALCRELHRPVVSTSANISGEKAPAFFDQISEEIKKGVDYIARYRREDKTPHSASNIIKVSKGGVVRIIR